MQKLLFVFVMLMCAFGFSSVKAQIAPTNSGIFFQAVARDNYSNPAKDRTVYVEASIIQNAANGTKVLTELFQTTTDGLGVFSISIGSGTRIGGTLSGLDKVDWANGPYFLGLKIAIKPLSPVTNWDYTKELIDLGASAFGTVPYAFYSAGTASVKDQVKTTDTAAMLLPYAKKTDLTLKVNLADSSTIYVTPTQLRAVKFDTTSIYASLNQKEILANKSTSVTTDATSDVKYPSVRAIKSYVDLQFSNFVLADGSVTTAKLADGAVTDAKIVSVAGTKVTGDIAGNAATATLAASATKLATPRTINGVAFDGTSNITIATGSTVTDADATTKGVVQLAGDLTGTAAQPRIANGAVTDAKIVSVAGSKVTGDIAGNAATATLAANATKLATPRTINGVAFDGTSNITIATGSTVTDADATTKGVVQLAGDLTGTAAQPRIANGAVTDAKIVSVAGSKVTGDIAGNAATATLAANATKLATPRTINGVAFDGTSNITIATGSNPIDADATTKGIVQLAGDLTGTAAQPRIANGAVTDAKIADVAATKITGAVAVANGGTGATTAAGARTNLGLVIGTDVLAQRTFGSAANNSTADFIAATDKGANNGVATLGNDGKIPSTQIPAISFQSASVVANQTAMLALTNQQVGSIAIRTDNSKNYVLSALPSTTLANWVELATPTSVTSVNGNAGPNVVLTAADIAGVEHASNKSNDVAADAASTTKYPTVKSIKDYVDQQNANAGVADNSITSAKISGPITIAKGGTGATTAAGARTNLGLVIGTDVMSATATTTLTGDVTGSGNGSFATTVNSVGGVSSSTIATLPTSVNANTNNISLLTTSVNANSASITAEITRAINAEAALDTRITSNTASITSNTNNINSLTTSVNTNTASITAEITRATNAEAALDTRLASNTASITANTNNISSLTTNVNANTTSITAEITRATNAEAALNTRIASNTASITANTNDILLKAPINSPTFTGTPTAPTPATSDNSTKVATTEYVQANLGTVSAGTLTGTTLASTISGSSLTSVGTITSGTWSGTTIAVANGGTGATTAAGARTNLGLIIGTDVLAQRSFGSAANNSTTDFIAATDKGANNGVATLGNDGKIPSTQIPAISFQSASVVANQAAMLALANQQVGSIAIRTDNNKNYVLSVTPASTLSNWVELATPSSVTSVNGNAGPNVVLTAADIAGVELASNKSNSVSADGTSTTKYPTVKSIKDYVDQQSANAGVADNSITSAKINGTIAIAKGGTGATTAADARTNLGLVIGTDVMSATATATLTGDVTGSGNGSFATTVNSVGGVSSSTIATLPTSVNANTASITANTADILLKAPINSPTFTGTPTAPTPATSDNSTKIATTEYVKASITASNAGLSSIGAISGTSNANGATISGTTQLILTPADATNGGVVTTGAQTFAGAKTFNNDIIVREILFGYGTHNKTNNIAIGRLALNNNTSDFNVAIGNSANSQAATTSGGYNVALGYQAMRFPNSRYNVAIGSQSFYSSAAPSSGDNNVAVGYQALYNPGTGANNTVLGYQSLFNGGANNSILGAKALYNAAGALNNVAVGDNAGLLFGSGSGTALTSSTQSIFIGSGVRAGTNTSTNEIAIGYNVVGNGSNTVTIGNNSITANYFRGDINLTGNLNGGTWSGTTISASKGGTGLTSPGASGNILTSDGTNWISSAPAASGVSTLAYSTTGSTNGGTISGTTLTLRAADATNPGLISTGTQTITGDKTFNNQVSVPSIVLNNGSAIWQLGAGVGSTGVSLLQGGCCGRLMMDDNGRLAIGANYAPTTFQFDVQGNGRFTQDVTAPNFLGNATTATTAGNITATANTTLTTLSSLNTVGTITSGTWSGTTIGSNVGGAGTVNGLLKANGSGVVSAAVAGTDYQGVLTAGSGISISAGTISATGLTTSNLASNAAITNTQLANSSTTLGTTTMTLGGTVTSVTGLTSVTSTGFTGALTGNASTATKFAATKNINGVAFDGSADITIAADANTLTGTTLASNVVNSSLTSVGTITTGVWSGTTIAVAKGGTGLTSPGTSGNVLTSNGTSWVSSTPSGVNTITYTSATSYSTGGTISGTTLTLSAASATNPGLVSTGDQTFVGSKTFSNTTTFNSDITVNGLTVGRGKTAVISNTAIGLSALSTNTSGSNNTGIGYAALSSNLTGSNNTAVGSNALRANNSTSSQNSAFGSSALYSNTGGTNNTAIGFSSLYRNTTGNYNAAFGGYSLFNATGSNNSAFGYYSLISQNSVSSTGSDNTAFGFYTGSNMTSGSKNLFLGSYAGSNISTSSNNIMIGYNAGSSSGSGENITTGQNSVLIGYDVRPAANGETNQIVISGYNGTAGTVGLGSNSTLIGSTTTQQSRIYGALTVTANTAAANMTGTSSTIAAQNATSATFGGGNLNLTAGNAGTTGQGGNIILTPGTSTTAANNGIVRINGQVQITGGSPGAGEVLMSDANGLATWSYSIGSTVVTSTTTYAITLAEAYVFYTGTAAGAFTIPAAASTNAGKEITIKNKTAFGITITPATGTIFIDSANTGAANVAVGIEASNNWIKLVSDGTQWNVIRSLF